MTKYPHVFDPIEIRGVIIKNRLEQAPPGCFFAADDRGFVTDAFVNYFRQYARGGTAVITVGNCSLDITESSDEPRQLQLSDPDCVQKLKLFSEMCDAYGAVGSLELTHNGKDTAYEAIGRAPFSVSSFVTVAEQMRAARLGREPIPTVEMSREKIKETVAKYARAARFCKEAGMRMCMVHGAHGNLIAQFASPFFNRRTDEYGGSLENRARFAIEILDAVREAVGPKFVIEYRISADEIDPRQMHFPETLEFIELIKDKVDILHVSNGLHDVHGEKKHMTPMLTNYTMAQAYNVHFAAEVKKRFPGLLVSVVGAIKDPAMAEEIIASGKADFVAMNRALHADYDMARKYAEGREWEHTPCLRCPCFRIASPHTTKLCSVNPMWGRFDEYPDGVLPKAPVRKKTAVIGGGPAGVEAVKRLLERGHDVTLYEREAVIGGHICDAVAAPFKTDLRDYLKYMQDFIAHCGARVLLSTEATPELLAAEKYDAVIAAVGAEPVMLDLPGADMEHVHWAPDAENGKAECGENVVIIGGSTVGTEASITLAMHGKKCTVLMRSKEVDLSATRAESELREMSAQYGVVRMGGWKPVEIRRGSILIESSATGERKELPADTVLMATGLRPRVKSAMSFAHVCPETSFSMVGDVFRTGDVRDAVWHAFEAARYI